MDNKNPLILIVNDDSIEAPGLRKLIDSVRDLGKIIVVAPDKPQSGQSHALTIEVPLRLTFIKEEKNYIEYSCSGTPADCVKITCQQVIKQKPDFIFSGVNHGSNASVNAIYSGTMAAVIEGCMMKVPSVGFSLTEYGWQADMMHIGKYIHYIAQNVILNKLPDFVCLNVNFPPKNDQPIQGIRICRQGLGEWDEEFEERIDPQGRSYYWIKGNYKYTDNHDDTDVVALQQNYISIVPTIFDWTAKNMIEQFKNRFKDV